MSHSEGRLAGGYGRAARDACNAARACAGRAEPAQRDVLRRRDRRSANVAGAPLSLRELVSHRASWTRAVDSTAELLPGQGEHQTLMGSRPAYVPSLSFACTGLYWPGLAATSRLDGGVKRTR